MSQPIIVEVSIKKSAGGKLKVVVDQTSVTAYRALGDEVEWRLIGDALAYNLKLKPKKSGALNWPFPYASVRETERAKLRSGRIKPGISNKKFGYTVFLKKKKGSKLPSVQPLDPDIVIDDDPRGFIVDGIREYVDRLDGIERLLTETVEQLKALAHSREHDN